jgi:hypothetical protein
VTSWRCTLTDSKLRKQPRIDQPTIYYEIAFVLLTYSYALVNWATLGISSQDPPEIKLNQVITPYIQTNTLTYSRPLTVSVVQPVFLNTSTNPSSQNSMQPFLSSLQPSNPTSLLIFTLKPSPHTIELPSLKHNF